MEFDEEIREFLIESNENLALLDREIIQLEQNPKDMRLVSSAFRTIHTIKGTCGFFGYGILGSVTHITENILSQVREGERDLTPDLISLVLEAVDAVKGLLAAIESTGSEGEDQTGALRARLEAAHRAVVERTKDADGDQVAVLPASPAPVTAAPKLQVAPDPPSVPALVASPPLPDAVTAAAAPAAAVKPSSQPVHVPPPVSSKPPTSAGSEVSAPQHVDAAAHHKQAASKPLPHKTGASEAGKPAERHVKGGERRTSATEGAQDGGSEGQLADSTIRVDVALLNRLMNLVGELVLARNQLLQDTTSQSPALQQTSQRLNLITSELQEGVMKTRMQPIGVIWNKLPRIVRDLASQCGKRIQIEMEGASTELDKTIIEAIKDPLTHIVRNSCDHGIEMPEERVAKQKKPEGLLLLRAYHEGGVVNIEISDDGAGISPEKLKAKAIEKGLLRADQAEQLSDRNALSLIFLPGFSTAAAVTSISGRGVGMDVVKTNIEKIGGSVEVQNRPGRGGTTIRIKIPLTLAIIPGLLVTLEAGAAERLDLNHHAHNHQDQKEAPRLRLRSTDGPGGRESEEERFIIPQANLLELVRLESPDQLKRIENVHGTHVFHHRSRLLPLVYLSRVLGRSRPLSASSKFTEPVNIVVVQAENRQLGLVVDRICDTQEIVVKPLGRQLKGLVSYVGATIMGDGRPALILDVAGLARLAGLGGQTREVAPLDDVVIDSPTSQPQMMLLFRAGPYERLAVPLALVDRLEEIDLAQVECAAGRSVLYYRGDILPLVAIGTLIGPVVAAVSVIGKQSQVIVFASGTRRLGLVVDQILDIVDEPITALRTTTNVTGLLGSAVIGGRITDLLDLDALVASTGESWVSPHTGEPNRGALLVPPASAKLPIQAGIQ
jgi:two-component system chemotaxis sensor kinase CheA